MSKFLSTLPETTEIPAKIRDLVHTFYTNFKSAAPPSIDYDQLFLTFLDLIKEQVASPFTFEPYHERIRKPFDYYTFGIEFLRPLVDLETSTLSHSENLKKMEEQIACGENVILFANHQTEADPQLISLILENQFPKLAEEMIFVAGERVTTDILAIPFSMGRNLLCIYSKRYIDNPPEKKHTKQLHNKKTMQLMSGLLKEGGKCIYVAPSGGRDRANEEGVVKVAPFDPQSVEMFYLMARKAKTPTHFYPLALSTYHVLPPPADVQIELGETRIAKRAPIHFSFGKEIDMEHIPSTEGLDKHTLRKKRTEMIYQIVNKAYNDL